MIIEVANENQTKQLGERLGRLLNGGEVIELVGDVGAGKTTFTKGLAKGLGITDDVQSPSFTVSRVYQARDDLTVAHYDFYRLSDPGIMANELAEVIHDQKVVTIVEWATIVKNVLPNDHITISLTAPSVTSRQIALPDFYEGLV